MPFDATPVVRLPLPDTIAAQLALVLDMMEFYFRAGAEAPAAGRISESRGPGGSGASFDLNLLQRQPLSMPRIGAAAQHANIGQAGCEQFRSGLCRAPVRLADNNDGTFADGELSAVPADIGERHIEGVRQMAGRP